MKNILTQKQINKIAYKAYRNTIKNGGATLDLRGRSPKEGCAHATCKDTEQTFSPETFSFRDIASFIKQHQQLLQVKGNYIGPWMFGGKFFVDNSRVEQLSPEIIKLAQDNQQLAVYVLSKGKGKEIPVGKINDAGYAKIDDAKEIYSQYCSGKI